MESELLQKLENKSLSKKELLKRSNKTLIYFSRFSTEYPHQNPQSDTAVPRC